MKKILFLSSILLLAACAPLNKEPKTLTNPVTVSWVEDHSFIQKGSTAHYYAGKLTVNRVTALTDYSKRGSAEIAGQISNQEFFNHWQDKKFVAQMSFQRKNSTMGSAVLELFNPKIGRHNSISYSAKIITGKLPEIMGKTTLVITTKE